MSTRTFLPFSTRSASNYWYHGNYKLGLPKIKVPGFNVDHQESPLIHFDHNGLVGDMKELHWTENYHEDGTERLADSFLSCENTSRLHVGETNNSFACYGILGVVDNPYWEHAFLRPLALITVKYPRDHEYMRVTMATSRRKVDRDVFKLYIDPELDVPYRRSKYRSLSYIFRKYAKPALEGVEIEKTDLESFVIRPEIPIFTSEEAKVETLRTHAIDALKRY